MQLHVFSYDHHSEHTEGGPAITTAAAAVLGVLAHACSQVALCLRDARLRFFFVSFGSAHDSLT